MVTLEEHENHAARPLSLRVSRPRAPGRATGIWRLHPVVSVRVRSVSPREETRCVSVEGERNRGHLRGAKRRGCERHGGKERARACFGAEGSARRCSSCAWNRNSSIGFVDSCVLCVGRAPAPALTLTRGARGGWQLEHRDEGGGRGRGGGAGAGAEAALEAAVPPADQRELRAAHRRQVRHHRAQPQRRLRRNLPPQLRGALDLAPHPPATRSQLPLPRRQEPGPPSPPPEQRGGAACAREQPPRPGTPPLRPQHRREPPLGGAGGERGGGELCRERG
eukprot:3542345-Rhodomonas_salina.5